MLDVNAESFVLFSVIGDAGHAFGQMMKSAVFFSPWSISASFLALRSCDSIVPSPWRERVSQLRVNLP